MLMETKKCERCGTEFTAKVSAKRRYCSGSCAAFVRHAERIARGDNPRQKTGEMVPCETCGTLIYRKAWQKRQGFGRFCSEKCRDVWAGRNAVIAPCQWCGKPMKMSTFRGRIQRFCSWECQVEGRSKTAIDRRHNGRRVRKIHSGYIQVFQPDHPKCYKDGWMLEHRLVAEQTLGRLLETDESVHHISGDKADNRPENLAVLSPREHQAVTQQEIVERRKREKAELAEYRRRFGALDDK